MMKQLILFLLLNCVVQMQAQVTLSGTVHDKEDKRKLENVIVTIKKDGTGGIVKFVQTASDGTFRLEFTPESTLKYRIEFSLMSYKKYSLPLDGKNHAFNIGLEPTSLNLKEVTIKAHKIGQRGDTVSYNVASFADVQDRTIGDVLKKMPGINVSTDGKISYNGVDINRFYIEGKDLLEGRYGLATNNASYKDMGKVEVLEKHQPIKALQDISLSEQAAINLKLKDGAKAKWVASFSAASGYSTSPEGVLWKADAFAMNIKKGSQNITTAKSNNVGEDLMRTSREFISGDVLNGNDNDISVKNYITPPGTSSAGSNQERTMFNRSHLLSTSQLWELKGDNDSQLKTQVNYFNNRVTGQSDIESTYYLPDGTKVITEDNSSRAKQHALSIKNVLEINKEKLYLKNTLTAELSWNDYSAQTQNQYAIMQKAKLPVRRVENDLQWVKRTSKIAVTMTSNNQWWGMPQQLTVTGMEGQPLRQNVDVNAFFTNENASLNIPTKHFVLFLKGGISGLIRSMDSRITGLPDSINGITNDINTRYLKLYVQPGIEHQSKNWKAYLAFPINYFHYNLGKQLGTKDDASFTTRLSLTYDMTRHLAWRISGSINRSPLNINNIYDGLILTNYRNLRSGLSEYAVNTGKQVNTSLSYRDAENAIFGTLVATRLWNSNPFINTQSFIGNYLINTYKKEPRKSDSWLFTGMFSGNLDFLRGMIEVLGSYMVNNSSMLSGDLLTPYQSRFASLGGRVNGHLLNCINWSYGMTSNISFLSISETPSTILRNYQHDFGVNIIPSNKFHIQLEGEYYHNEIMDHRYKDLFMADIKASFRPSKKIEITASMNNLLNHKDYSYSVYSQLNTVKSTYAIRGREFLISVYLR